MRQVCSYRSIAWLGLVGRSLKADASSFRRLKVLVGRGYESGHATNILREARSGDCNVSARVERDGPLPSCFGPSPLDADNPIAARTRKVDVKALRLKGEGRRRNPMAGLLRRCVEADPLENVINVETELVEMWLEVVEEPDTMEATVVPAHLLEVGFRPDQLGGSECLHAL